MKTQPLQISPEIHLTDIAYERVAIDRTVSDFSFYDANQIKQKAY